MPGTNGTLKLPPVVQKAAPSTQIDTVCGAAGAGAGAAFCA